MTSSTKNDSVFATPRDSFSDNAPTPTAAWRREEPWCQARDKYEQSSGRLPPLSTDIASGAEQGSVSQGCRVGPEKLGMARRVNIFRLIFLYLDPTCIYDL